MTMVPKCVGTVQLLAVADQTFMYMRYNDRRISETEAIRTD